MPGVNVVLHLDSGAMLGTTTDTERKYRLENVPVGRGELEFRSIGYKASRLQNIIITSGREVMLNVELEENVTELQEFEVVADVHYSKSYSKAGA